MTKIDCRNEWKTCHAMGGECPHGVVRGKAKQAPSELIDLLDRLRTAKAAALIAAKSCELAGETVHEACFVGEVIGLEKAAAILYGEPI